MDFNFMGDAIATTAPTALDAGSGMMSSDLLGQSMADIGGQAVETIPQDSLWGNIGSGIASGASSAGNFLTSDAGASLVGSGVNLYGAYNANQLGKDQLKIQEAQLAQSQDAYDRDVLADEARSNLSW